MLANSASPISWLRRVCSEYRLDIVAIYRRGAQLTWPLIANSLADLEAQLNNSGHFLPLPKEPAALANILEVSIVDYLIACAVELSPEICTTQRGRERGYPDLEISGSGFGGGVHAIDVKVARRARNQYQTDSRITLYTGNTYFRYPSLHWPGTLRPFDSYASHLDLIAIYTLDESTTVRIKELELIVQEPWRIASTKRSSTTREYIGAVLEIDRIRNGSGEFETEADFYNFWRKYKFKIGPSVQQQLDRLLRAQNAGTPASTSAARQRRSSRRR